MTKDEFRVRFLSSIRTAMESAAMTLQRPVAAKFAIELHGAGVAGALLSFEDALNKLYMGSDRTYRVIDVGVKDIEEDRVLVFVRPSGHRPSSYDEAWHGDLGPFKVLVPAARKPGG